MAKYDDGFKRKVVEAYQNGEGDYNTLAQLFSISVKKWVKSAEKQEVEALQRQRTKQLHSSQFKQVIIRCYLTSGDSYLDVALQYVLSSGNLLQS